MKLRRWLLTGLLAFSLVALTSKQASAACSGGGDYGSVSLKLSVLPKKGKYTVWARLQIPNDSNNRVKIEINNEQCFELSAEGQPLNQWIWTASQTGGKGKAIYDFNQTEGNIVKVIGVSAGVKFDRLILTRADCEPVDTGENCQPDSTTATPGQSTTLPALEEPVSGVVYPSSTLIDQASGIKRVDFYIGTKKIQSSEKNFALDTTRLPNGKSQVTIKILMKDGTTAEENTELDIHNPENTFSPLWRWVRLNQLVLKRIGLVLGSSAILGGLIYLLRRLIKRHRLQDFHGF